MGQQRKSIFLDHLARPPTPSNGRLLRPFLVAPLVAFMTELGLILSRLDLGQYLDKFVFEGFDTWETLSDITEADLYGPPWLLRILSDTYQATS